jgi:putative DNA primase/helicase
MWRRIKLIPFHVQFGVDQQDSTLKEKLFAELPGILNWAIEGALAWQAEGKLVPPDCVVAATEEYRSDQDVLRDFIAEKIEPAKDKELAHKDLYRAYKAWNAEQGSDKAFSNKRLAIHNIDSILFRRPKSIPRRSLYSSRRPGPFTESLTSSFDSCHAN